MKRIAAAFATLLLVAPSPLPAAAAAADGILLEAEAFADKGGWMVDPQFVEQMGSPYLLAHGLGRPVAPAKTTFRVNDPGPYRVWVRTKNWAPGDWEAPGRFQVAINGRTLDTEFGTEEGWQWQDGGQADLPAGEHRIELRDLTGFDGRCDAIFLAPEGHARPPAELKDLTTWRNERSGLPATPPLAGTFDVVIVGGGIAGCGAALSAAEQGLRVALIHDRPVLGGNASAEVRVHTIGITGYADRHLNRINSRHWPNGSPESVADDRKRHATMDSETNIQQFLSWRAYGVAMAGSRLTHVNARHVETGEARAFAAPVFIDTTGDGWIGFWAGAEYRYGREARDEFDEGWDPHGDLWSPAQRDGRVMGVSLLWYALPKGQPAAFPDVPWAEVVAKGHAEVKGEWFWEYSADHLDMIRDAEAIRDHMLRAIYGSFANARKQAKYAGYELDFVGYISGKRESRRLVGDYVYTMKDMTEGRKFPDAVATETRDIDLHYQRAEKNAAFKQDFLSEAIFRKTPRYYIPYRALYSKNIENLLMAGRCFSCSHVGLGGPRVMNTCGQMGVAVGYAAALVNKHHTTPRGVYERHLEELVRLVKPDPAIDDQLAADAGEGPAAEVRAPTAALTRIIGRFPMGALPADLKDAVRLVPRRGDSGQPAAGLRFTVNQPVEVFLAVHDRGAPKLPAGWTRTDLKLTWEHGPDTVYRRSFPAGAVELPGHDGRDGVHYGVPHLAFLRPQAGGAAELKVTGLQPAP